MENKSPSSVHRSPAEEAPLPSLRSAAHCADSARMTSEELSSKRVRMPELALRILTATVLLAMLALVESQAAVYPIFLAIFALGIWGGALFEFVVLVERIAGFRAALGALLSVGILVAGTSGAHLSTSSQVLTLVGALATVTLMAGRAGSAERASAVVLMGVVAAVIFGLGGIGLLEIVRSVDHNSAWSLWLISLVVITDVAAYAVGRMVGGPKLALAISPGKTIAGAIGACVAVVALSPLIAPLIGVHQDPRLTAVPAVLAICVASQIGDLLESLVKRLAGVKDSGRLLPGHGGLYDRVDGLLAAAAVFPFLL